MKTIRYIPKDCQGEGAKFSGYIELRLPLYEEKLEYMEACGLALDSEGKIAHADDYSVLGTLRAMMRCAKPHYVDVKIDNVETKVEYRTYEDLSCDADTHSMISEVAGAVFRGLKVGND